MKITIRNAHEEWREPVEKETNRQAAKLDKLLKRYSPDLVQLHADIEKHASVINRSAHGWHVFIRDCIGPSSRSTSAP